MSEALVYVGVVKEIGAVEMSKDGTKQRPRKVVITDNPNYQGKTFRCWNDSMEFMDLQEAANSGEQATVHYHVQPNPDPTRHGSNMIDAVQRGEAADWSSPGAGASPPGDGVGSASAPVTTPAPVSQPSQQQQKDNYWERKEVQDADRTLEIEAAWGVHTALENDPKLLEDIDKLERLAIELVGIKREVAKALKDSPGATPVSPPTKTGQEQAPGRDVGSAGGRSSPPPSPATPLQESGAVPLSASPHAAPADSERGEPEVSASSPPSLGMIQDAFFNKAMTLSDALRAASKPCLDANLKPPTNRAGFDDLPEEVLAQVVSKLNLGANV